MVSSHDLSLIFFGEGGVSGHEGPKASSGKFWNKIFLIIFLGGGLGHGGPGASCHMFEIK